MNFSWAKIGCFFSSRISLGSYILEGILFYDLVFVCWQYTLAKHFSGNYMTYQAWTSILRLNFALTWSFKFKPPRATSTILDEIDCQFLLICRLQSMLVKSSNFRLILTLLCWSDVVYSYFSWSPSRIVNFWSSLVDSLRICWISISIHIDM